MAGVKKRTTAEQTTCNGSKNGREEGRKVRSKRKVAKGKGNDSSQDILVVKNVLTVKNIIIVSLAVVVGVMHGWHISSMFENDRFFSHLSDLEREMTFRTEMGLYYSYYKTMIKAPTLGQGLYAIMRDNVTEYPNTINTLKRFNLYPEVFLAVGYRVYDGVTKLLGIKTKECFTVNRGRGLSQVLNCEGMGDPSYFYVNWIFIENGILMSTLFLFAVYLSNSLVGGILTVACVFYNHGECTRVQWTPPLRESFAYPIFVMEMFVVTHVLRIPKPTWFHSLAISLGVVGFMLPWQFAQFALLTQTLAIFATYMLGFTGSRKVRCILQGQSIGLFVSYFLLFGNEMLLTSYFASCLFTVWIIVFLEPLLEKIQIRILIWVCQLSLLLVGMLTIKWVISTLLKIEDDAHIANLFRSKFSDYKDFHTMLYTCAVEFDFMQTQTLIKFLKTLLLPTSITAIALTSIHLFRIFLQPGTKEGIEKEHDQEDSSSEEDKSKINEPLQDRSKPHAEVVYNLIQLFAFIIMAILIMRLKMFLTPHLCLVCSLLASRQIFKFRTEMVQHAIIFGLLSLMSIQGVLNLRHQWNIQGDFANAPQEELLEWIKANTPKDAVFAGPMPTMASVKLSTERRIVNHPHYEDAGLRARTLKVYAMYSRKSAKEVYAGYKSLKAQYAILEMSWCTRRSKRGCSMPEIWDIEDPKNAGKKPLCIRLQESPSPYFTPVFSNSVYIVLKL